MNIKIFRKLFPNDKAVADFIIEHIMNNEIKCPFCGKTHKICRESTKLFHCNNCNSSFSIFKGTIFEHSRTSLVIWFYAINLMLQAKKSTSAKELERLIGVTYKTAWRINHQIRKAMSDDNFKNKFSVMVEIDETYIGGKPRAVPNKKNKRGRGTNKTPVVGVREKKSGMVYAKVMLPNENGKSLTVNFQNF